MRTRYVNSGGNASYRLDTTRPFPEVRQASLVNTSAKAADQDPAFSARIREGLIRPPLLVLPADTE